MIKAITDDYSVPDYNKQTLHPLQTWEWGEARKKTGVEVLRLGEYQNNKLINVFQLTFHKIPKTNYKVGYLPRSVFPAKDILDFLYDYGKKNKVIYIKIEPYEEKLKVKSQSFDFTQDDPERSRTGQKLVESKHPLFPSWTQILDLTKEENELLKNMHSKTRYNIHLAEKKGVVVKEMSDEKGFEIFSKLYFETTKRQKYFGHDYQYHKTVWDNLKNKISHILIAYYNDIPLAAYQLWYSDGVIYYVYGGTSELHRNLMASNLLMWEAIKLGKKLGATKFDMWGSLGPGYNPTDPWSGFTRFKEGYGTKFTEFIGSYDLVINPLLYKIYNAVYSLREIYLKLKR